MNEPSSASLEHGVDVVAGGRGLVLLARGAGPAEEQSQPHVVGGLGAGGGERLVVEAVSAAPHLRVASLDRGLLDGRDGACLEVGREDRGVTELAVDRGGGGVVVRHPLVRVGVVAVGALHEPVGQDRVATGALTLGDGGVGDLADHLRRERELAVAVGHVDELALREVAQQVVVGREAPGLAERVDRGRRSARADDGAVLEQRAGVGLEGVEARGDQALERDGDTAGVEEAERVGGRRG